MQAGGHAGLILALLPNHQAVFNLLPLRHGWEKASLCTSPSRVESWFPTASGKPCWFFLFQCWTPERGYLLCDPNPLLPRKDPRSCDSPSSSGLPTRDVGPDSITSPPFLPDSGIFLYRLGCRRAALLVFSSLSERCSICSCGLMCSWR